jgi:hypothetical protein
LKTVRGRALAILFAGMAAAAIALGQSPAAQAAPATAHQAVPAGISAPAGSYYANGVVYGSDGAQLALSPNLSAYCTGWVCLYANSNFGGRALRFGCGYQGNLTDWGFNDQMSSWSNNTGCDAKWFYNVSGTPWPDPGTCMQAWSTNSYVGNGANDGASRLEVYTDGAAC